MSEESSSYKSRASSIEQNSDVEVIVLTERNVSGAVPSEKDETDRCGKHSSNDSKEEEYMMYVSNKAEHARSTKLDINEEYCYRVSKDSSSDEDATNEFSNNPVMRLEKTNAFGQVEFIGGDKRTRAKYIRLTDETSETAIENIMNWMQIGQKPKILISVVGGMRKLQLDEKVAVDLKENLVKVCKKVATMKKCTWFLTSGIDKGVTKLIAEAVKGYRYSNTSVIGVVSWDKVYENNKLITTQEKSEIILPKYPVKSLVRKVRGGIEFLNRVGVENEREHDEPSSVVDGEKPCFKETSDRYFLNKDHTHFFLVDTGVDGENQNTKIVKFRNRLERFIVTQQHTKTSQDPDSDVLRRSVQLVINGGYNTLIQIIETLFSGHEPTMPLVVIADSGKVAKWIATECQLVDSGKQKKPRFDSDLSERMTLRHEIEQHYPDKVKEILEKLRKIANERRKHITIYKTGDSLDKKILDALMTTNCQLSMDHHKMVFQWNSVDVAYQNFKKMFDDPNIQRSKKKKQVDKIMKDIMMKSLLKQNVDFFNMLLEVGFQIDSFEKETLLDLYEKVASKESKKVSSTNIISLFIKLKDPSTTKDFKTKCFEKIKRRISITNQRDTLMLDVKNTLNHLVSLNLVDYADKTFEKKYDGSLEDPLKDLFLWAVLCNKQDIAEALWRRGENPIAKALIARRMYLKIAKYYNGHQDYDENVHKTLLENARNFERKAVDLLEKCSATNTQDSKQLVDISNPSWGNKSLRQLAALSGFQEFISHPRCKDISDRKWRGAIQLDDGEFLNIKVLVSVVFFLPLFFLIRYSSDSKHKGNCCGYQNSKLGPCSYLKNFCLCKLREIIDKLFAFYNAPVAKFWMYSILYVFFLLVYIYTVVNPLNERPKIKIYILMSFVISSFFEEVRQILGEAGINSKQKFQTWWSNYWNKIEALCIVLFTIGFVLHFFNRVHARYVYSITLFLFVMKILKLFSLSKKIGVYVVIIQKMLIDVGYFVLILLVLVIGYGVVRFSLLYPEEKVHLTEKSTENLFRRVFLVPFFQLFGEIFIESAESAANENVTVFGTKIYQDERKQGEVILLWFTFCYMVLTCLCLVNLLIAVFNYTYERVQDNADRVWHWHNYHLVREYQKRSILPPPLSIFSRALDFYRKSKRGTNHHDQKRIPMKEYFEKNNELYKLLQFETNCLANYEQQRK